MNKLTLVTFNRLAVLSLCLLPGWPVSVHADVDLPTKFSNQGGIINTRHNLTQSTYSGNPYQMDAYRNNYGEVCVYCHTPHGANEQVEAPLWNRTMTDINAYSTYDQLGSSTITSPITAPGPSSVTCLSCHDGTLGVDSIVNMPGSGNYDVGQKTSQSDAFLNTWNNASGTNAAAHMGLNDTGCVGACHSPDALAGPGATDFTVFAIGTDLTNDHPVGILFPGDANENFNATTHENATTGIKSYDSDGDGRISKGDIRFYDSGEGYEVECASCHDPHGVPSTTPDSVIFPSFLRASNEGSTVCLTCHNK